MTPPGWEAEVTSPQHCGQPSHVPCASSLRCAVIFLLTFTCRSLELFYTNVAPETILLCV